MKMYVIIHPSKPTFYLNPYVQGIVSADHAVTVALDVMGLGEAERWRTTAVEISMISPADQAPSAEIAGQLALEVPA